MRADNHRVHWLELVLFVTCLLLSLLFIGFAGATKLLGAGFQREMFQHFGYPLWLMYAVGLVEVIAGVLILIPRLRFWGGLLMLAVVTGAIVSFFFRGEPHHTSGPLVVWIIVAW
ncbi:MAG: DoxX family protein, partial [Verrucomicrobiota bacterium]